MEAIHDSQYSLEQIGEFLLEEQLALHGIAPAVHRQNLALVDELASAAESAQPGVLGVHLVGSRAQGTSDISSDVDLCVVGHARESIINTIKNYPGAEMSRLVLGFSGPVFQFGLDASIPTDAKSFLNWVRTHPDGPAVLLQEGIYDTPDRRLAGLAALAIRVRDVNTDLAPPWALFRGNYAHVFLGGYERITKKLAARLDISLADVRQVITFDLIHERREKFGLPDELGTLYAQELAWFAEHGDELAENPGHRLYQDVQRLLNPPRLGKQR